MRRGEVHVPGRELGARRKMRRRVREVDEADRDVDEFRDHLEDMPGERLDLEQEIRQITLGNASQAFVNRGHGYR